MLWRRLLLWLMLDVFEKRDGKDIIIDIHRLMRMNMNMKKNVGFMTLVVFVVCFGSFVVVDGLLPPSQVPPCFGAQGSSERGIDVYYSAYANSFYTSSKLHPVKPFSCIPSLLPPC
jgi:hypothetical protein